MAKVINLDMTECENRETRIGTIIGWDGKASDLISESEYEQRRSGTRQKHCAGEGRRECQLCELNSPFTQQTMCANAIVNCQAGNLTDCILIEHSPIGCSANHPRHNLAYHNGCKRRGKKIENSRVFSTNLTENDMVFGASNKLRTTIRDAWERYQPKAIFIATACATAIIGEDIDSVAEEMEDEIGIPVIPLHCEGFRSKHWSTGFDIAQHGVLRQIVRKNPEKKQDDLLNIVALWGTDYFTDLLKPLGIRVNYLLTCASYEELAQASEARATSTFCFTLGSYFATGLEQHYGVPQIDAPMPYGLRGTDEWLREVARVYDKSDIVEDYIQSEHERIAPKLEELREKLKGVKGMVMTGSAYAHGLICVLRELGIGVDGSVVFHHDPAYDSDCERQNSLKFLVDEYGDIPHFTVSKTQPYQLNAVLRRAKTDFIIIRHNGLAPVAAKLGIPSLAMGDEHFPVGYDGIIRLGELILNIIARKKFNQVLQRHSSLGYTQWWLDQDDPFILANHPEVLDEPINEENGGVYDGESDADVRSA